MAQKKTQGKKTQANRGKLAVLVVLMCLAILAVASLITVLAFQFLVGRDTGTGVTSSGPQTTGTANTTAGTAGTTTGSTTTQATTSGTVSAQAAKTYVQKDRSQWNLILVNDYNPLPEDFESTVNIVNFAGAGKQCDERIVEPLRAMLEAGKAYDLRPVSMFRDRALQTKLYNNKVKEYQNQGYGLEDAQVMAATVVKRPGESEHNTGLTIDIGGSGDYSVEETFASTPAYEWLIEHCAEYGFILRYPKDKEDITAVIYEPWHFRYVGVEAATEIMERGICLEEYIAERGM